MYGIYVMYICKLSMNIQIWNNDFRILKTNRTQSHFQLGFMCRRQTSKEEVSVDLDSQGASRSVVMCAYGFFSCKGYVPIIRLRGVIVRPNIKGRKKGTKCETSSITFFKEIVGCYKAKTIRIVI